MIDYTTMNQETAFFAMFCIESLSDFLGIPGSRVYELLTDESSILDTYIVPHYDVLHTQGKDYIVEDLIELMKREGVLL